MPRWAGNLVNDMIDVKLVLKAPQDASGFQFDFDFFSSEWPNYVCSNFNDAFVAYLTSSTTTDTISYDSKGNPVAVNILGGFGDTYQTQCDPSVNNVTATLGASTGWLTTKAPIQPGEQFTLEFMIWDAGDGLLDSSVLVDHFQWLGGSVSTGTTPVQ